MYKHMLMNALFVELLSVIFLIEANVLYYLIIRKYIKLSTTWTKLKDKYLINIFSSILDFISSDEIIEQSLVSSTLNLKTESFKKFLEDNIKNEKDKILKMAKYIEDMEKIEKDISKIFSYTQNSKYLNISSILFLIIALITSKIVVEISNEVLGTLLGLELISIYFSLYSYFIYKADEKKLLH
ncbi:hypothetical protein DFR86_10180 [Acidianus sulfidivorans JP7]|uniref:Uncharacterized protein n=1 Tax=Acidianus sulfidivorans JP7 TaxID=619593 RepID=A0A2U9IPA4_9CREN|nr:hypothetical protein [Acidianus sulfidivorans]AWR97870.1 hypothetical protein DFR86_10180 [Acidianus sulfidivorans JP7]